MRMRREHPSLLPTTDAQPVAAQEPPELAPQLVFWMALPVAVTLLGGGLGFLQMSITMKAGSTRVLTALHSCFMPVLTAADSCREHPALPTSAVVCSYPHREILLVVGISLATQCHVQSSV